MSMKFGISSAFFSLAVLALIAFTASPAVAVKEFKDAFQAKYVKPDSTAASDVALAEAFRQASCTVCHAGGDNKKIRNDYGKQLAKLVSKQDKKNKAKIQAALDAVAKLKSKPVGPGLAHVRREDRQRQAAGGQLGFRPLTLSSDRRVGQGRANRGGPSQTGQPSIQD